MFSYFTPSLQFLDSQLGFLGTTTKILTFFRRKHSHCLEGNIAIGFDLLVRGIVNQKCP